MSSSSLSVRNGTVLEDEWSEWDGGTVVACSILAVCFVVGVPGNLLVVWTILQHVKQRSHTVLLILHLSVADLMVLVTLPLWIYSLAYSWVFGQVTCKAMVYIIHACMYASVFLITIMSVERFLAVRYPFKMLQWKTSYVMHRALGGVWVLALVLGIPAFLAQDFEETEDGTQHCDSTEYSSVPFEVFCGCLQTLVGFVIPFFILAVCYCQVASQLRQIQSRNKQKSAFLIGSVVVAFALCWLPHHVVNVANIAHLLIDPSDEQYLVPNVVLFIVGALAFISSSVNPMLYAFAARNFQGGLRRSAMAKLFQEVTSHVAAQVKEKELQTPDCSDNGMNKENTSSDV
ncbi:leukotriene B4 receptor 1-like [Astyanax mexicanus]|uniref:leukotriene B4 receptor 1-like n=1 Tax=Astyanax mexicanus TaxID=7994 RepID=UPI00076A1B14|nr:leukotriene B4 receptor 1-like [Astyanax mexicanus]